MLVSSPDQPTGAGLISRPTNWCWCLFPDQQTTSWSKLRAIRALVLQAVSSGSSDDCAWTRPCFFVSHEFSRPLYPSDSDFTAASASVGVLAHSLTAFSAATQLPTALWSHTRTDIHLPFASNGKALAVPLQTTRFVLLIPRLFLALICRSSNLSLRLPFSSTIKPEVVVAHGRRLRRDRCRVGLLHSFET